MQFVLLSAIWGFGLSFMFIKVGDQGPAPLQVAFGRLLYGAATLMIVLAVRREGLPRDPRVWRHLAVAALLVNALPFSLFAYAETHVTSVIAGMWNATTPLLTLLVAMLVLPEERPSSERVLGIGIGFAGVLVLLGIWHAPTGGALLGNLACLAAAAGYALGFPYVRRNLSGRPESSVALSTGQLLCGAAALALITPLPDNLACVAAAAGGRQRALAWGPRHWAGLHPELWGHPGCRSYIGLHRHVRHSPLLYGAGVLLLGERLSWYEPLGGLVVIVGVAVSQGGLRAFTARLTRLL